jgi:hypothetical protein
LVNLNDVCELKKNIKLDTDRGLEFYYYMYGRQIGTLLISANDNVIWSLSGSQDDEWLYADIVLPKGDYQVCMILNKKRLV